MDHFLDWRKADKSGGEDREEFLAVNEGMKELCILSQRYYLTPNTRNMSH